jgi:NitT/TauT family transport system permease protein
VSRGFGGSGFTTRLRLILARALVVAAACGLWWISTNVAGKNNPIIAQFGPSDAMPAFVDLWVDGSALRDATTSLRRLGLGLLIAVVAGVPLGLLLGMRIGAEQATAPLVQLLRMISPLAWAPAAVSVLGIGDAPVTFLVAIAAVWPIALGTSAGVRALSPGWSKVARSLGATPLEHLRTVVLPGVRPQILTSVRLALGVGWIVLVPAEMLGVDSGLGYAVLNARDRLDYGQLAATIILIGTIGYAIDAIFQRVLSPRRIRTVR